MIIGQKNNKIKIKTGGSAGLRAVECACCSPDCYWPRSQNTFEVTAEQYASVINGGYWTISVSVNKSGVINLPYVPPRTNNYTSSFSGSQTVFLLGCSQQFFHTQYVMGYENGEPYIPSDMSYGVTYYTGKEFIDGQYKHYITVDPVAPGWLGYQAVSGSASASFVGYTSEGSSFSFSFSNPSPRFGWDARPGSSDNSSSTWSAVFNGTPQPPECVYAESGWGPDPSGYCGPVGQSNSGTGPHCPEETRVVAGTCPNCETAYDMYGNKYQYCA